MPSFEAEMSRRGLVLLALFSMVCVVGSSPMMAQLPTATISGTVRDPTGGVIPRVAITVTNTETGLTRSGTTAVDGSYKFPALPAANYEVRAEQAGFQREVRSGLKLGVGQDAVINLTLEVGAVEQTVTVTADAPLIETTTANVSGLVGENEVRDLPLNARNLMELAALFPGITIADKAGHDASNGFATKLAILGTRYNANLFQLDGQDINDSTGSAGGAAGILMGVETVREFNVVTSGYSAEYGKHTGGVFNAITKSGSNSLHGSAFEFLRNDKLDARNFFDQQIPPYKRNQFGFSLGGPMVKDRTFWFGSYEGLRERLGLTPIYLVPDAGGHRGVLPNPTTGQVQTVAVDPKVQPFVDSYPLPNGRIFGNGTGEFAEAKALPTNENFLTVRADHSFSAKDSLFGRYTFDNADRAGNQNFNSNDVSNTRSQYVAAGETHLFSPQVVNLLLLGFTRSVIGQVPEAIPGFTYPTPNFTRNTTGALGNIQITGLSQWGGDSTIPSTSSINEYQAKNDVFYTSGRNALKFGFNAQRMQYRRYSGTNPGGIFSFSSLANFLQGNVNQFRSALPNTDPVAYPRVSLFGFYAQDDIRVSPRMTLNLGLRYEPMTTPYVLHNRVSNLHNYFTPGQTPRDRTIGNPIYLNPSLKNYAPRLGFAWDPTGGGKTSIRGGAGIFYDQVLPGVLSRSFTSTPPFSGGFTLFAADHPAFPDAFFQSLGGPQTEEAEPIQYKLDQPTVFKYSLDVQRAVTSTTSVEAGFAATRGWHLMEVIIANMPVAQEVNGRLFIPSNAPLLHPAFGRIRPEQTDATSSYYGLRTQVIQRYSHGLTARAAYTYSKTLDDASNFTGMKNWNGSVGQPRYLGMKERALAAFDIRHALTVNFTYDLPVRYLTGAAAKIAGGWQLNGIFTAQTGPPFTITGGAEPGWMSTGFVGDYPDLVPGAHIQYNRGNPNRYFDPSAFANPIPGFVGNLARNFGIGPGIGKLDLVLAKNTHLSERVNLQFRSEFFNILNRANFEMVASPVFDARTLGINPAIGRITNTSTTSRQIQFGLKVEF